MWLCGIRTDQQAELPGRQGSGSISCHEHKSLWWAWWQPSSKPLQPIWVSWCGRYAFFPYHLRIQLNLSSFKYFQSTNILSTWAKSNYYLYIIILFVFQIHLVLKCCFYCTRINPLFSVKQRHQLSQARGSSIPVMTTTLQIHSMSQMNPIHKRQGTLLTSPIRTQTSSLTQNPQSPDRGKERDLLTWASTCMLTTFAMKMRSLTSKT